MSRESYPEESRDSRAPALWPSHLSIQHGGGHAVGLPCPGCGAGVDVSPEWLVFTAEGRRPVCDACVRRVAPELLGACAVANNAAMAVPNNPEPQTFQCPECGAPLPDDRAVWDQSVCDECHVRTHPEFACPECGGEGCCLNVGRYHWFVCDKCRVRWLVGSNLFSSWREQTEEQWDYNAEKLQAYREVGRHWVPAQVAPGPLSEESEIRIPF